MKRYSLIVFFVLLLFNCNSNDKLNQQINKSESIKKVLTSQTDKKDPPKREVIKLIKELVASNGFLNLPYKYDFNQDSLGGIQIQEGKFTENYNRLRQFLGCSQIIGILPDTSNYFGIVVGLAASAMNIELITIDKEGIKIARESLIENNCLHYVEEDIYCHENVVLNNDLSINYSYETLYIMEVVDKRDTVCQVKYKSGKLFKNGQIKFDDSELSKCK
jgi:hypothetical protein